MNIHACFFSQMLMCLVMSTSSFAVAERSALKDRIVTRPEEPGKKQLENFEVLIVTGLDKDGRTQPPYLIITEQRFIEKQEMPAANLTTETLRVLVAGLLVCTTSDLMVGEHKLTIVRKIYEFIPPGKRYILYPDNFDNLKDSYPFRGLIIDTDGKKIEGDIGPPRQMPSVTS